MINKLASITSQSRFLRRIVLAVIHLLVGVTVSVAQSSQVSAECTNTFAPGLRILALEECLTEAMQNLSLIHI